MEYDLPSEIRILKETLRRFVDTELIPIEMQLPENEDVPEHLREKARAAGLWGIDIPEEYGGAGMGLLARCIVWEELFRSKAVPYMDNTLFGPLVGPILYSCNEEQKKRFLFPVLKEQIKVCFAQTEPDAGSDPASMRTRAVREGDNYVVNGMKRFITGAPTADWAQVICVTDPEKRARGGISCLMVSMKAPGVKLARIEETMMGDRVGEIHFDNVIVPVADRIGEEGQGFELGQGWITEGRILNMGAKMLGIAQRAYEMMADYANQRVTFGSPLADRQAVQFMVADSAIELHLARLMVYQVATRCDEGKDIRDESFMTKIYCSEMAAHVVDRAIQIHGGMGLTKSLPLEYWYRNLRASRITEGATEVLKWRLARNLLRSRQGK